MASLFNAIGNVEVLKVGNLASCEITWRNILLRVPLLQFPQQRLPLPQLWTLIFILNYLEWQQTRFPKNNASDLTAACQNMDQRSPPPGGQRCLTS